MQITKAYRNKSITGFCGMCHRYMLQLYASSNLDCGRGSVQRSFEEFVKSETEVIL